ncbi:MAG: hypothetical protein SO181_08190 [Frisingicoccus sp.]|uniref:hypothetical protein n=1 Tax=Frisingicoccus sp. TaxID=1918627 RepID=UPI002A815BC7|nr:hypothetical protein [Frisingicoccus sp.]MDY4835104.1 hypothetical protein [Frisingicoccus sp.]
MAGKYQRPGKKKSAKRSKVRGRQNIVTVAPLNCEQERILKWLKQVRFRRALFGGVDESDLWKKIGELNSLYEDALFAERARYDALLEERCGSAKHGKEGDDADG